MPRNDCIRKEILFQAYAKRPLSVNASGIHRECRKQQLDYAETEIKSELAYLESKKYLQRIPATGSEITYAITADGTDHYEQNYAA